MDLSRNLRIIFKIKRAGKEFAALQASVIYAKSASKQKLT